MGYDHFALISVASEISTQQLKLIQRTCEKLRKTHEECLFGEVHHLTSGSFGDASPREASIIPEGDYWTDKFDDFMLKLYKETGIKKFDLYVCEFDGESLVKHQYVKGIKRNETDIEATINDDNITCYWNIESLVIKRNITIFYNQDYHYCYS